MTLGEVISTAFIGVGTAVTTIAGLAQAAGFDYSQLWVYGPLGIMCGWMMWRMEGRMKASEAAQDRATRATMLVLIEIPAIAQAVKGQAKEIVSELDEAKQMRGEK
jgi:hypothetical protein